MRNLTRQAAALTAALLLCPGVLTACNGGGSNSTTVVTHVPALQTFGGKPTINGLLQTTLLVAQSATGISLPGGPAPAAIARRLFSAQRATRQATGACVNGVKQSSVTNSDATVTTTTDQYYDVACTQIASATVITNPKSALASVPANTVTTYDTTGKITSYQTLLITVSTANGVETLTVDDSVASSVGGTQVAHSGITCVGAPGSATPNCTMAHAGSANNEVFGDSASTTATAGSAAGNATSTIAASFFIGSPLTVAESGTTWGVSGALPFNSGSGTYAYATDGTSGTFSLKDPLYGFIETATFASATGFTVGITQDGVSQATATIDRFGNGTVAFTDNTSEPVAAGFIGL